MKVAIIGSRSLNIDISSYVPKETTEIISGGAKGIDTNARKYAILNNIKLMEFLPDYNKYDVKIAPLMRNKQIVEYAEMVIAIWDGQSRGTIHTVEYTQKLGKKVILHTISITSPNFHK